ncbi:luciferin 4-monooxygenase-like [Lutzomyia longipalpis]|uniref:luciferin 4-monooxygenase-like n=1 Tax=Lutzomyia longipalpis TaxID=7200 RepID=UPI002483965B|nr:luciferin 4-monooxygenase-like [Lutzomyia longipalpis]
MYQAIDNLFKPTVFDEKALIWRGGNSLKILNNKASIGAAALCALNQNPDFVAQISDNSGVRKTNREIRDAMLKIAVNLGKIGCSKGDVVGFLSSNNEEVGSAVLATLLLAAQVNALDPSSGKGDIIHMFGITRPQFIFCEEDKVSILVEALECLELNAKIIIFGDKINGHHHIDEFLRDPGNLNDYTFPEIDDKTCAFILCSSGTTGMPKGVAVSHKTLLYFSLNGIMNDPERPSSIFCFSSLYWYTGILTLLMGTFLGISRIITTEPYSPDLFYEIITKHRPNMMFVVSMYVSGILNHPLLDETTMDSIKFIACTGSTLAEPLWKKIKKYLRNGDIYCGYGMTEIGWVSREPGGTTQPSVGNLLAGVEMKILDKNGKNLGIGQQGELHIKWENRFLGYYNNPQATAAILDEDGWIQSGDIAYFDKENLLHVVGRSKDILDYKNFHIAPLELENLIITLPGVVQAVVVGVPDALCTELPAAAVICQEGSSVSEKDIEKLIELSLSDTKRLRGGVFFVESFPLTASGKIKRPAVKEIVTKLYKKRHS